MRHEACVPPQNVMQDTLVYSQKDFAIPNTGPVCPLTGDPRVEVLEEIPASLIIDSYKQDLGLDIAAEFNGVESLILCRSVNCDLIFFYPAITGSSRFYQQLQTFDWYYPPHKYEYEHAAAWIHAGDRVLDIGCGNSHFAAYIPEAHYSGLEPQPTFHHLASRPPLTIYSENIVEHAATHSAFYDAVCCFQVLEHVADPANFIRAALACLKPGGLLILGMPSMESYLSQLVNFSLNAPPHHVTWWTDRALRSVASQFELDVLSLNHAPVEPWECRLYWMQRIAALLMHPSSKRFTASVSRRLVNIGAYLTAGIVEFMSSPTVTARGASVVFIASKRS